MIFDEKYNNVINLLGNLKKEFKDDYDKAVKLLPNSLVKKCKSKRSFEFYDGDILASFNKENKNIELVTSEDNLFIEIQVSELSEKEIERMKEFEVINPLFFALDIEDSSIMYDLEIRKVRDNRFVISIRKDNEYNEQKETYFEMGKRELVEKLNTSNKR